MATLVLLNGPPASGKSTLARRLVAARPMALCLDIDVIRGLLGDWLALPEDAGLAARSLAITMARTHLEAGHDVFVPQFLGRTEFIDELEQLATDTAATFVEIALRIDRRIARQAFHDRSAAPTDPAHHDAAALVEISESEDPIGEMFDRYVALLTQRLAARHVDVIWGDVDATVDRVEEMLPTRERDEP